MHRTGAVNADDAVRRSAAMIANRTRSRRSDAMKNMRHDIFDKNAAMACARKVVQKAAGKQLKIAAKNKRKSTREADKIAAKSRQKSSRKVPQKAVVNS